MLAHAIVHEKGGYEEWLKDASTFTGPLNELGAKLYQQRGCSTCHSVDGSPKIGPTWKGLFGKQRNFEDGSSATADENYLKNSINNPAGQVVAGYPNSMPTFQGKFTDQELNGIVEYIKTLK
ncbi:MAG: cytochrome c [Polyangiaceae bacterium]|nr:cytochrome c [Polyangiaceae bacterium]